jgi:hypothetical protein
MRKIFVVVLAIIILGFVGCKQPTDEPTYVVWTYSIAYTDYESAGGESLDPGRYGGGEITNNEFNQIDLPDNYKHEWTESQIYDWFIGLGFGAPQANDAKSWLFTVNHGFIRSRIGNVVHEIIK